MSVDLPSSTDPAVVNLNNSVLKLFYALNKDNKLSDIDNSILNELVDIDNLLEENLKNK